MGEANAIRAGYGPTVLSVIKGVLEYVLVAGIVGGGYSTEGGKERGRRVNPQSQMLRIVQL
jgi:hypothetical protein